MFQTISAGVSEGLNGATGARTPSGNFPPVILKQLQNIKKSENKTIFLPESAESPFSIQIG